MRSLSILLAAASLVVLMPAPEAAAQNYPWCAQYTVRGGARNCGFVSFAQCMATVSGIGGWCEQNAMFQPGPNRPPPRKVRRARYY
jgi:uncharacterized protein DUF3551